MKKVSICIPAYKRADVLKRCLDSVFEQDFDDFQITKKCISDPNILIKEAVYLYRKLSLKK